MISYSKADIRLERGKDDMNEWMARISAFASGTGFWVYVFIFFGKEVEVALSTLRIVLINRGIKVVGAVIAFIEVILWLLVASTVLSGLSEDFMKGLVYAVAYALGNYLGACLDDWLAFGLCFLQAVITDKENADAVTEDLRSGGFAVTTLDAHGRDRDQHLLMMTVQRRRCAEAVRIIRGRVPGAVIWTGDVKSEYGSYFGKARKAVTGRIGK